MQFVQMYTGHPHFYIKTVPLAEIHQLQVRLRRGAIAEQLGCFNSDLWDGADFCTFFKRHFKSTSEDVQYLVHAFFAVRFEETFAKNNQLALRSRFKKLFSRKLTGLSQICISAIKECPQN